jgi:DNA polymerase-3 subunit epsilon
LEGLFVIGLLLAVIGFIALALNINRKSEVSSEASGNPLGLQHAIDPAPAKASNLSAFLPQRFIVLDLETTGLSATRHEIIEFGAIRVNLNSSDHDTFQTFVRPERKLSRKITEITGITQKMVDTEGVPLEEALTQFIDFIGDLPLVTFNAEFDMGFLYRAAQKHGVIVNNRYTCALKRARRAWPGLPSYRLVDLAKMGRLSSEDTHRALGDCARAMVIFTAATSTLGQKVKWSKPTGVPDIQESSNEVMVTGGRG